MSNPELEKLAELAAKEGGFELISGPSSEGQALRFDVRSDEFGLALLYVWERQEFAANAAWAHHPDHGAQLFAVPELLKRGDLWCVIQPMEGVQLSTYWADKPVDAVRHRSLLQSVGRTLRKLHTTTPSNTFGVVEEVEGAARARWLTFNGYVASELEQMAEAVRTLGFEESEIQEILAVIGSLRQELASFHPRNPASLVHGRLSTEHIWIDPDSQEVTAVTGFEYVAYLPSEYDWAWLLWIEAWAQDDSVARELYRGYGAARTMDVQRRERFYRRFVALQALHGKLGEVSLDRRSLIDLCSPSVQ